MEPREDLFGFSDSTCERKLFRDRRDAGSQLAGALLSYRGTHPLVLGIPRGGVPVAYEIAKRLNGELDVIVARKIGAPGQPELAVGAVASDGTMYVHPRTRRSVGLSDDELAALTEDQRHEAERRELLFRAGLPALHPAGRVVILVDDGLATGATMCAAIRSLKHRGAEHVVIAVPVGSGQACAALGREADALVCLHRPEQFRAVGPYYAAFDQTSDEEVEQLLRARRQHYAAVSQLR